MNTTRSYRNSAPTIPGYNCKESKSGNEKDAYKCVSRRVLARFKKCASEEEKVHLLKIGDRFKKAYPMADLKVRVSDCDRGGYTIEVEMVYAEYKCKRKQRIRDAAFKAMENGFLDLDMNFERVGIEHFDNYRKAEKRADYFPVDISYKLMIGCNVSADERQTLWEHLLNINGNNPSPESIMYVHSCIPKDDTYSMHRYAEFVNFMKIRFDASESSEFAGGLDLGRLSPPPSNRGPPMMLFRKRESPKTVVANPH